MTPISYLSLLDQNKWHSHVFGGGRLINEGKYSYDKAISDHSGVTMAT